MHFGENQVRPKPDQILLHGECFSLRLNQPNLTGGRRFAPPRKSRSAVLKLVQAKIRLRHFAFSTEQAYCHWAGRYYDFCLCLPKTWPAERKTEAFLTDLALKQGVAARTPNQALAALLFLYGEVLAKPLGDINALRAKQPVRERTAPPGIRCVPSGKPSPTGLPCRPGSSSIYSMAAACV